MENVGKPKLYKGLIVFAAVILLLLFAAAPMQHALGITGLLLTELMLLICALAAVFIFRYDIRKVIPLRLPKLRQVLGVLLLWAGALLTGYLFIFITMVVFPKEMTDVSKAIGDYVTDAPILVSLVITALMPALAAFWTVSGLGKKPSEAITAPFEFFPAFLNACIAESTREGCPVPIPTVFCPLTSTIAFDLTKRQRLGTIIE